MWITSLTPYLTTATANSTFLPFSNITNSAAPYVNATGGLSSNVSNLYVQKGVNTIQSAIDVIISGQAYSIQISAGGFTENITLTKQNYTLSGAAAPLFSQVTQITGNIIIGNNSVITTRTKLSNLLVSGNLTFTSDATNQQFRHVF